MQATGFHKSIVKTVPKIQDSCAKGQSPTTASDTVTTDSVR